MKNYTQGFFKGKKITVMGLGLLGRGVGDALFFVKEGAEVIVTDLKSKEELASSVQALSGYPNITFALGGHRLEDFQNRDFILKAAGVPLASPFLEEARKNKVPIEMSTSLFAALTPATIVGVTGTRGKSTVTHLIYEILKKAYEGSPTKVFLGGNVRGVSTLSFLSETKPDDVAVLELDSWQLQGFGERKISPRVAVFTTFLPDHLNYYGGNLDAYLNDKANVFRYQAKNDVLVLGKQAAPLVHEKHEKEIHAKVFEVDNNYLPKDWVVNIPGIHNRYNAALARKTAELFNIDEVLIKEVIERFKGVPGRLELVREYNGISIYNDTTATTPDATLAALRAFGPGRLNVLIMGGADKNLEMGHLFVDMPNYTKAVVLLPGTGSDRIEAGLMRVENVKVEKATNLADAVVKGLALSRKGENLILSPGFASFGLFRNEFDRGDQFNEIVRNLQ